MPAKNSINILGIEVDNLTIENVLEYIQKIRDKRSKIKENTNKILQIVTINPEIVILAKEDPVFKKILNSAEIRVADGIGIILAGKFLGENFKERITGLALTKKLSELGAKDSFAIGLIGGRKKIAVRCGECLEKLYPKLQWWGEEGAKIKIQRSNIKNQNKFKIQNSKQTNKKLLNSSITNFSTCPSDRRVSQFLNTNNGKPYSFNNLVDKINQTRTSILLCAFGAPKQEFFIDELRKYESKLDQPLVAIGVGGVFDELTKTVSPAPEWLDKIGLKWLWRLIHEPWRWKRQVRLGKFLYLIILNKLVYPKTAFLR